METRLDFSSDNFDIHEQNFLTNIREHGWFNTHVHQDEEGVGFSFSTGFFLDLNMPEIIVFDMDQNAAHQCLWNVHRLFNSASKPVQTQRCSKILAKHDVVFLPVDKNQYSDYLGWSRWFYKGDNFECWQMVWPDPNGKFPWEEGFDESFAASQPDITEGNWAGLGQSYKP